ncbi:MAG: response regulator transcription factor [Longimicrobiales bacterium]
MPAPPIKILLVEDEEDFAFGLRNNLEIEGFRVGFAPNGRHALRLARRWRPDLVILDLMLPDVDGLDLIKPLRKERPRLPILILSARARLEDRVLGLQRGDDDYVTKPFALDEFLARAHALVRRGIGQAPDAGIPKLVLDQDERGVWRGNEFIPLRRKEFKLLAVLMEARGEVLSKTELLSRVWGFPLTVVLDTHRIEFQLSELRRKIEPDLNSPVLILTYYARGIGINPEALS